MGMPSLKRKDFENILRKDGFTLIRTKGDHFVYENREGQKFVLPMNHTEIKGAIYINYCRTFGKKKSNNIKNKK